MKIGKLKNKLNSQNGITAADSVIAMLIILTTVGVISMIYVNLNLSSAEIQRKAGATRVATNILENMSKTYYAEIETKLDLLSDHGEATKVGETYTISGSGVAKVFDTTIPKGYTCEISFEKPNPSYDVVRKVNVKISYKVNDLPKEVVLRKVIEKETIRECNSPKFSEEYIRQIVNSNLDYIMASDTSSGIQSGVKIICPVMYDKKIGNYKLVNLEETPIWYSYSNKNWARLLILEANDYNMYINETSKTITDKSILQDSEKSFVWIPRFGVKNGENLFGGTYFKYKKTNLPILNSYENNTDPINYYIDSSQSFTWGTRGISFETNTDFAGKWVLYSSLNMANTDGYVLNHSQYGPMIEY